MSETTRNGDFRVALIYMPFSSVARPSIQMGLLKAIAQEAGFPADTYHFNLDLASRLTLRYYEPLCTRSGHNTSDWLFSHAAFGDDVRSDKEYFEAFPQVLEWLKQFNIESDYLSTLRHDILPAYIEDCLNGQEWGKYKVVGFSSTLEQNVASLALARRIKERHPEAKIVFGGANFAGEMGEEYVRALPYIDYAVLGEGDIAFPELLKNLAKGMEPVRVPGVVGRSGGRVQSQGQAPPT